MLQPGLVFSFDRAFDHTAEYSGDITVVAMRIDFDIGVDLTGQNLPGNLGQLCDWSCCAPRNQVNRYGAQYE